MRLLPGVAEGLATLTQAGFRLCLVTNQQGIGLGYFPTDDMIAVNHRLIREAGAAGAAISKIYFCPHTAADNCSCRKPNPGLVRRALRDFAVRVENCVFVGDSTVDVAAGRAAGCATVQVGGTPGLADFTAPDFTAAVAWILARHGRQ
jgi:D-glycero-D-manno-heptose 1,7-bisphosphate phosphatase